MLATFSENWIADIEGAAEIVKRATSINAGSVLVEVQFAIENIIYWTKATPAMTVAAAAALDIVAVFSELLRSRGQAVLPDDPTIEEKRLRALEALKVLQAAIPSDVNRSAESELLQIPEASKVAT